MYLNVKDYSPWPWAQLRAMGLLGALLFGTFIFFIQKSKYFVLVMQYQYNFGLFFGIISRVSPQINVDGLQRKSAKTIVNW